MNPIFLEKTKKSPKILLDKEKGLFEISGRSIQEDSAKFYTPIIEWIKEYAANPNPVTDFQFNLEYFNSSSAKLIVKILFELERILKTPNKINVTWIYEENDDVSKERGEEIASTVKLPFEMKAIPSTT